MHAGPINADVQHGSSRGSPKLRCWPIHQLWILLEPEFVASYLPSLIRKLEVDVQQASARWGTITGAFGVSAVVGYKSPVLVKYVMRRTRAGRILGRLAEAVDHKIGWHRLPVPLGLLTLVGIRNTLREQNLVDTEGIAPSTAPRVMPPSDGRHLKRRMPDGTCNDLQDLHMGAAGARFGRNVPVEYTYPDPELQLLSPNPRTVSRELLTRDEFQPATTLNVLAAAWLQFMIRDWFSHGPSPKENPWQLKIEPGDTWHESPMTVLRTRPDPTRPPGYDAPPTYANTETHWWDGSQLYGSSKEAQQKVRSGDGGKLAVNSDGTVPIDEVALQQPGNWLGLAILHNLFTLEHNSICEHLQTEYPNWSDDELFEHARLINAALLAKIHTVEWTTGILGHPTMQIGMRANWWGLATERIHKMFGRIGKSELISGIPGSQTNHFGVPYSLTEEFVAVYRMHPLIPDDYRFRYAKNNSSIEDRTFRDIAGPAVRDVLSSIAMPDLLHSFGTAHPGAIQLHNYPKFLQTYQRPDGIVMDLAATDILRSRELGVPRYNQFRKLLHLKPVTMFEQLTDNPVWAQEIRRVYDNQIDRVDLTIGMYAERPPAGFGFSDTAFRIFVLMASRRLNSDRFFTVDYTPEVYSEAGMKWIDDNDMSTVLLRHYPELKANLAGVKNAFAPWSH
jgi:hypothetical protein